MFRIMKDFVLNLLIQIITYSFSLRFGLSVFNFNPKYITVGPHQDRAPVTNATQVNPAVDNINVGLKDKKNGHFN